MAGSGWNHDRGTGNFRDHPFDLVQSIRSKRCRPADDSCRNRGHDRGGRRGRVPAGAPGSKSRPDGSIAQRMIER